MRRILFVAWLLVLGGLLLRCWAQEAAIAPGGACDVLAEEVDTKTENKGSVKECLSTTVFVCPAHPDLQLEKKGKCAKCAKKLEKKQILTTYCCPDKNCDYQSAKPGKCLTDGQELVKTEVKPHCPKCNQPVEPEDLILKPVK